MHEDIQAPTLLIFRDAISTDTIAMPSSRKPLVADLGFLRLGLLGLAILNTLIAAAYLVASKGSDGLPGGEIVGVVASVMAPLFLVVIFFDYVMCRVRAADAEGEERRQFRLIGRIELAVIGVTLLYWVPFFYSVT